MRYKVPQNIDMEDRIVGPLTMVQFVTVMIGGMIVYVSYLLFTPTSFWIIAIPVTMATLALAFLKVNDQPFPKFLAATLLFLVRPKNRVWQKTDSGEALSITHQPTAQETRQTGQSTVKAGDLAGLATVLDTGGTTPIPTTPPVAPVAAPLPPSAPSSPAAQPIPTAEETPPTNQRNEPNPLEQNQLVTMEKLASLRAATGVTGEQAAPQSAPVAAPTPPTEPQPIPPVEPQQPTPGAA